MAAAALVGPPELQGARTESAEVAAPMKGLTENSSPTFLSSGDPLVDFFFQVVPSSPPATVADLLAAAWKHDAATAFKLVAHLRGVRGTGKSDRQSFYAAALWMHKNHPKTLALNAAEFAGFGYMKDLLEILHRLVTAGIDTRKRIPPSSSKKFKFRRGGLSSRFSKFNRLQNNKKSKKKKIENPKEGTAEERVAAELAKVKIRIEEAAELRHQKRINMAAMAIQRYFNDWDYRFLYDKVVEFFAELLGNDYDKLKAGEKNKISLAAKWCPSLGSSYDRSTLICEAIARRVFPRDSSPEYAGIDERHYAYRVRDRLRKEVLVPLRRALELPEVYIGTGQWSEIPYKRVPSVAMKNYKNLFRKHDSERFGKYLDDVMEGKAKIAAGALLPHQLLEEGDQNDQVAELQWRRMVADVAANGKLKNCIAVCDVSGSMSGTPMEVAVALGLLVSELSEAPWKDRVITFSENPQLHHINGGSLREKTAFIKEMDWGMNTDFQKVFDRILEVAEETELPPEKMIKRVFVFSDMEFDTASTNSWETDYEAICRKFAGAGYGEAVPEMVFWNLRDSRSTPVVAGQKGVALVSGFSKNLLKMFLENGDVPDPKAVMYDAVAGDEYNKLQVFD